MQQRTSQFSSQFEPRAYLSFHVRHPVTEKDRTKIDGDQPLIMSEPSSSSKLSCIVSEDSDLLVVLWGFGCMCWGPVKANGGRWQNKDTVYPYLSRPVTTSSQLERSEADAWLWHKQNKKNPKQKNREWKDDASSFYKKVLILTMSTPTPTPEICTNLLLFNHTSSYSRGFCM